MAIINPSKDDHSTHSEHKTKRAKEEYNETKCFMRTGRGGDYRTCFSQADLDKQEEKRVAKKEAREKMIELIDNKLDRFSYSELSASEKRDYHNIKAQEARTGKDLLKKTYRSGEEVKRDGPKPRDKEAIEKKRKARVKKQYEGEDPESEEMVKVRKRWTRREKKKYKTNGKTLKQHFDTWEELNYRTSREGVGRFFEGDAEGLKKEKKATKKALEQLDAHEKKLEDIDWNKKFIDR